MVVQHHSVWCLGSEWKRSHHSPPPRFHHNPEKITNIIKTHLPNVGRQCNGFWLMCHSTSSTILWNPRGLSHVIITPGPSDDQEENLYNGVIFLPVCIYPCTPGRHVQNSRRRWHSFGKPLWPRASFLPGWVFHRPPNIPTTSCTFRTLRRRRRTRCCTSCSPHRDILDSCRRRLRRLLQKSPTITKNHSRKKYPKIA